MGKPKAFLIQNMPIIWLLERQVLLSPLMADGFRNSNVTQRCIYSFGNVFIIVSQLKIHFITEGSLKTPHSFTALRWKTLLTSSGIITWPKVFGLRQGFLLMTLNFSLLPLIDSLNLMPSTVMPFLTNPLPGTPFSFLVFGIYGFKEIDAAFNILISNLL